MKKSLFIFFLLLFPVFAENKPLVLVTVSPYKFFVNKIAGDLVDVLVMVPAGTSAHTYEPTPKEMIQASSADAWFYIGEAFEEKAKNALTSHKKDFKLIDLKKGVSLLFEGCCAHHLGGADLHFWLSPKEAKVQIRTIAEGLAVLYPEWKETFFKNLQVFSSELDQLDQEIQWVLRSSKDKILLVSHPAFAYFCRDYHLIQKSVEVEGKDPTPRQLNAIFLLAKKEKIRSVFIEPQYSNKGAKLIASELRADVVILDPYAEDYVENMKQIAKSFAGA